MNDPTEHLRRARQAELNNGDERTALEEKYGQVWDTGQMCLEFQAEGFMAPLVIVRRKKDGVRGSLEFSHSPRFYFNWKEA